MKHIPRLRRLSCAPSGIVPAHRVAQQEQAQEFIAFFLLSAALHRFILLHHPVFRRNENSRLASQTFNKNNVAFVGTSVCSTFSFSLVEESSVAQHSIPSSNSTLPAAILMDL